MQYVEFKVGDVVQLKSGGPRMTVVRVGTKATTYAPEDGYIQCTWFYRSNASGVAAAPGGLVSRGVDSMAFPPEALEKVR